MSNYTAHDVVEWTHYLSHKEVDVLQELARSLPAEPIVVNIGAGNGTSGLALMQSRDDLALYTIDIQLEASPLGCLEGERIVLEKAGFVGDARYHPIHGDSKEIGRVWTRIGHGLVDMVFVDGDHSYAGASGDIEIWRKLIKPNGIMAIHDYDEYVWTDVIRVVDKEFYGYAPLLRADTLIAYRMKA